MATTAYIALGGNLGDRQEHLERALSMLGHRPGLKVKRVSSFHETEAVGGPPGQEKYLNAVAELETELDAVQLLQSLLEVEQQLGRVRTQRWGPRTIDLDLLFFGNELLDIHQAGVDLVVPHPRLHERAFVLAPLAEIAPDFEHPRLRKSMKDMLNALSNPGKELAGQRIVVTGSTSGIGRAIALELARGGADVIVHGRRSEERAQEIAEIVRGTGGRSDVLMADVRAPEECHRLVHSAWQAWGGIDVWVNNAGADILTGPEAKWPFAKKLAELWAVDVQATILLSREVGQRMLSQGGVILNMGWDQSDTGMDGDSGQMFGATKGAVMAFSKSLAVTLAPKVRVNCLAPGWIKTAWGEHASTRWQERVLRETPLKRWGTPEDVASVARWLSSPAAAFITGQVIRVNGGVVRL